ncbi:MAG: PEP-CTERM sorting domain-containing protein [Opitutales bacterium]|nr:PEP-CTERM sorting domain-containing protein [Opitutales bacterium]
MKAPIHTRYLSSASLTPGSLRSFLAFGLLALGTSAHAVVIPFENLALSNTVDAPPDSILVRSPGTLTGTLTAIQADFVFNGGSGGTWASDLGVFITNQTSVDLATNGGAGLLQVGGTGSNTNYGATTRLAWGMGGTTTPGTPIQTTITLTEAQQIVFNGTISDPSVFLGFLWNDDASGTWTGEITLVGLSVVPEPATYALFLGAIGGLVALRRRRRVG